MTLGTHIVVGTTLATAYAGGPASAFAIGLATHYLLDAIPHWDYPIAYKNIVVGARRSQKILALATDTTRVLIDVAIGTAIVLIVMSPHSFFSDWRIIAAIVGAGFPDFLQFVFMIYKNKTLALCEKFHHAFHSASSFNDKPVLGITLQVLIIAFFAFALI